LNGEIKGVLGINPEEIILMNNEAVQAKMLIQELEEKYEVAYKSLMQLIINQFENSPN
jgi:hypothetical protein